MIENVFMPRGIPLLSDYSLLRLFLEYRQASSMLKNHLSPLTKRTFEYIVEALTAIENELKMRGVPMIVEEDVPGSEPIGSFSWRTDSVSTSLYQS